MKKIQKRTNKVNINSSQTIRKTGEIISVLYDRVWGEQYQVLTYDPIWGREVFWFKEWEIRHV